MAMEDVLGFLAALASAAEPVDVHFMWRPIPIRSNSEIAPSARIGRQAI
jgi:hypothetical protein